MRLSSIRELKTQLLTEGTRVKVAERHLRKMGYTRENPVRRPAVALGIAPSRTAGDFRLAIRMMDKSPETIHMANRAVWASRNEADIEYVGIIRAPRPVSVRGGFRKRVRPIVPGYSVGHYRVTAGTIGAFVRTRDEYVGILSNNHVLANTDQADEDDPVLQPGPSDGGARRDEVGWFSEGVPILLENNAMDAAVALMSDSIDYDLIYGRRYLAGARDSVDLGERVWKVGRTTSITRGRVTAFDVDGVGVDYSDEGDGSDICSFDGQIEIKASKNQLFSTGGDSGSLILDHEDYAVGLLFAGSDESGVTYANPISTVLDAFDAELLV